MTSWLNFILSSASLATIIGAVAIAVAVLLPPALAAIVPHLRTLAIYTAIGAFSYTFVAGKFYNAGLQAKQAEWDRAIQRTVNEGEKARDRAEHDIRSDGTGGMPDKWNRDEH